MKNLSTIITIILLGMLITTNIHCNLYSDEDNIISTLNNDDYNSKKPQRTIKVGRGKYQTISSVYSDLQPGTKVIILPGIYDEQIILIDSVDWEISEGAIIDYTSSTLTPTITDNNTSVHCNITGFGIIKRTGTSSSSKYVIKISNESSVINISDVTLIETTNSNGALYVDGGKVSYTNANIEAVGQAVQAKRGYHVHPDSSTYLTLDGVFYSSNAYSVTINGNSLHESVYADVKGIISSDGNSALGMYGGTLFFEGTASSTYLFGFEMGGGTATLTNSYIASYQLDLYEGDAMSKYGGEDLYLDNCNLFCESLIAKSIGDQGTPHTITLVSDCYANRYPSTLHTYIGSGILIVE